MVSYLIHLSVRSPCSEHTSRSTNDGSHTLPFRYVVSSAVWVTIPCGFAFFVFSFTYDVVDLPNTHVFCTRIAFLHYLRNGYFIDNHFLVAPFSGSSNVDSQLGGV